MYAMMPIRTAPGLRSTAALLAAAAILALLPSGENRAQDKVFTRADTLRGSITEERAWWDAVHYDIAVEPDYGSMTLAGSVRLRFRVLAPGRTMQLDLQAPMEIGKVEWEGRPLTFSRDGNAWHFRFPEAPPTGSLQTLDISYSGKPQVAKRPPWDGGWIFTRDERVGYGDGDSGPVSGIRARTTSPTSPTAPPSPSPYPTRSSPSATVACAAARRSRAAG
jgi:hypothetical protein